MKLLDGYKNLILSSACVGLGLLALTTLPASAAKETDVYRCKGDRSQVYACCNNFIEKGMKLKIWKRTRKNCNTQVACVDEEGEKCFVKRPREDICQRSPTACRKKSPNEETIKGGGGGGGDAGGGDNGRP